MLILEDGSKHCSPWIPLANVLFDSYLLAQIWLQGQTLWPRLLPCHLPPSLQQLQLQQQHQPEPSAPLSSASSPLPGTDTLRVTTASLTLTVCNRQPEATQVLCC